MTKHQVAHVLAALVFETDLLTLLEVDYSPTHLDPIVWIMDPKTGTRFKVLVADGG